jgi:hypothetical protein
MRLGVRPVHKKHRLLLAVAALGWFNAGVVWLIQFSCYPLWPYVGHSEFWNYHSVWWHSTWGVVFVPSVLALVGSISLLRLAPKEVPRWSLWLGLGLEIAVQLVTVIWLWPLDRSVVSATGGLNLFAYERLMVANWFRTGLVTAYAVLAYWVVSLDLWSGARIARGQWVLLVTSALGLYAVGNVWLVQLVCYRLWPYVGQAEAFNYHIAWWHSIWGVLFGPSAIVVLGAVALLWMRPANLNLRLVWFGLALLALTSAGTAMWWAPLMARLITPDGAMLLREYALLMSTHWIRVALITAYGITYFRMLIKSATVLPGGRFVRSQNAAQA